MTQIEHYPDQQTFCHTQSYITWKQNWQPSHNIAVDYWIDVEQDLYTQRYLTPREMGLTRYTTRLPFYLIDSLNIADHSCVDIGCGYNWFRQIYPSIWGVDLAGVAHNTKANEILNLEWWQDNRNRWSRVFSICSLHFCSQDQILNQLDQVIQILKPNGCAVITLNRARIQERTPQYQVDTLRETLQSAQHLTRMVWLDSPTDAGWDGNVWLWFQRN